MAQVWRMSQRDESEMAFEDRTRKIISSLLHLQSRLSTYVSTEDMEKLMNAEEAFDSRQMDIDELLVVIEEARQKAEERQAMKNKPLDDLQQALSRILAGTESWPSPLKSGMRKRCEMEQSWLNRMCDKAVDSQTTEEILTRIKEEVEDIEGQLKNLNDYFKFAEKNAELPEEPTIIPHFHIASYVSERDRKLGMTPISIYDTDDWGEYTPLTAKCGIARCPSVDKPHSHVIDADDYDDRVLPYLFLCRNFNCRLKHAHPKMYNSLWLFHMECNQDCSCFKHNKRPDYMPKEAEVFEQPIRLT